MLAITLQAGGDDLGSLVEYPDSEAARRWEKHFRDARKIHHYAICFFQKAS